LEAGVRIIALSTLKAFWESNPAYANAMQATLAWYRHTLKADWSTPAEVKQDFRNASILKDSRIVFKGILKNPMLNTFHGDA